MFKWRGVPLATLRENVTLSDSTLQELQRYFYLNVDTESVVSMPVQLVHFHWIALLAERAEEDVVTSIDDLVVAMIKEIDAETLRNSLACSTPDGRLYHEAALQFEVYRAAFKLFPDRMVVSPAVSHAYGSDGTIDFIVHSTRGWGIGIVREGGWRQQYLDRFDRVRLVRSSFVSHNRRMVSMGL